MEENMAHNQVFETSTEDITFRKQDEDHETKKKKNSVVEVNIEYQTQLYTVDETPPWYLCVLLGFQQNLVIEIERRCDKITIDFEYSSTQPWFFFYINRPQLSPKYFRFNRLPILQGGTFAFLTPTIGILSLPHWSCPYTDGKTNVTELPEYGSPQHKEMWYSRLREIQGAIMVASFFQIFIGFSGIIGAVLKFIGPLSITPTIALIGLALFPAASNLASKNWYIALMTMFLITLFSQYLRNIGVPVCRYEKGKGCGMYRLQIFKLFPVGQWGVPTVSVAGVFGMLAGVLASMVESVGDYYACARLAGAPPPPFHAVNRGIGIEGISCVLAGAWGSGNGTTSYSENVGAIGITKVGSRRVVQVGGIIMILLGCFGKFGALFVTIPDPVVGGVFMIMFGTDEERGIKKWREQRTTSDDIESDQTSLDVYNLPLIQKYLDRMSCTKYLPFCPSFDIRVFCGRRGNDKETEKRNGESNNKNKTQPDVKTKETTSL
ncbi:hypothetical protein KUTeg_008381 [Tegillarca granosa]|uniref:Solute carrier family 23 member 2 n=1 Tax=Tegillarca granosa TaxID=220873 RepID=A0ABQ9F906_TEGGR|nr:hypothetical protein KUTeg_008381 [Tegillarca granosa]